jgi:hypothetical protein
MKFLKENWIISACSLTILFCYFLHVRGFSTFSSLEGPFSTVLMLSVVFGPKLILSLINDKFGLKYTRRIDRIFLYIAFPVVVFTLLGFFQKQQFNNSINVLKNVAETRVQGLAPERKNYDEMKYGKLTPLLKMINEHEVLENEKADEYLNGMDQIYDMIDPINLLNEKLRNENKEKLNELFQGIEKYKTWMHSDVMLRHEKIKKLNYGKKFEDAFLNSAKIGLELTDKLMKTMHNVLKSIKEIIEYTDGNMEKMKLVDENIVWRDEKARLKFVQIYNTFIEDVNDLQNVTIQFDEHNKKLSEKMNEL